MSRAMLIVMSLLLMGAVAADDITREAEDYDRCQERLLPPEVFTRANASQGRLVGVRAGDTGYPMWLEYDFTVAGGRYELRVRAGGNDSRQAALLSVDGGKGVLVDDAPTDALPLDAALPADARERGKRLENSFREHLVGSLRLAAGRHRVRVTHAGMAGRSNSFGFDWLKLTSVTTSDAPAMEVGDKPEPEAATAGERPGPVVLRVLTSYRFWGPDEAPCYGVVLYNREGPLTLQGTLQVRLTSAARPEFAPPAEKIALPRGQARWSRFPVPAGVVEPGAYAVQATFRPTNGPPLTDSADLIVSDLNTPGWAKRAATCWVGFAIGSNVESSLKQVKQLVDQGITCTVNSNVGDWLGEEAISWPFRGDEEKWREYLDGVQDLGACHLMYHTMVTVSEHFYYEHRGFWSGRKPFYHCSWLSIYPDSAEWNRYQAADFRYALGQFPLDGIFLDNACATGEPGAREAAGEAAIAQHQGGLRRAIKQANPTGILYPNYNTLTLEGLGTVSAAWDAHMLEGNHPMPQHKRDEAGWTTEHFVTVASRVRRQTGKPFWPLMYTRGEYAGLGIAACAAARANPCGVVNGPYLHFLHDLQEYIYADDVFPAPPGTVALSPLDPDLAATGLVKVYPSGVRDWTVQIVNGTEENGKLAEREVELTLDLPKGELARPAWLLRPEAQAAEPVKLTNPLKLKVGVWTVLIIAEELLPRVSVSPACLRPVLGETLPVTVTARGWTDKPVAGTVQINERPLGRTPGAPQRLVGGTARLALIAPEEVQPNNRELTLAVQSPGSSRVLETPLLVRVRPRLEVSLHPNHFSVFPDGRPTTGRTMLRVTNYTHAPTQDQLVLSAPRGWSVKPGRLAYKLGPGETTDLPIEVAWPEFRPQGLYDLCDATLACRTAGGVRAPALQLPVRLHMPATWLLYCTLGTKPLDVVRNGATPGGAPLSSVVMTVRAHPEEMSDAKAALTEAIRRQKLGEQRVVVWFRAGGTATASGAGRGTLPGQLADPQVQALIGEFMKLGGGVILQENVFRDSVASRVLLKSDLCPVGEPYQAMNAPGGDWLVSDPQAPALSRFAALPLEGKAPFGIPAVSQPPRVRVGVKPWAMVAARNAQGDPAVVASTDPQRPIAYLGGAIEGTYMAERYGVHDYPEQMTQLLYFYAELARWLSVFGRH